MRTTYISCNSPVTLLYHFYYQIQHQLLPVCSISTPYTVPTSKICVKHKSSNVFPVILVPALLISSILLHVIISKVSVTICSTLSTTICRTVYSIHMLIAESENAFYSPKVLFSLSIIISNWVGSDSG